MMKKLYLIIGLIFLFAVSGLTAYYVYQRPDRSSGINQALEEEQKAKEEKRVFNILNSANDKACDQLATAGEVNSCKNSYVIKDAAKEGDLSKCEAIADKALANNCVAQASFSLAIQKRDKKYCENILNKIDKNECLKVLADMGVK